ncbi:MAG: hypothetical protein NT106_14020, partial [Candidatus Sumerlaeota bacterium]|nr:hypothetical protein [Candidatus Sumerlaeota bacterium]
MVVDDEASNRELLEALLTELREDRKVLAVAAAEQATAAKDEALQSLTDDMKADLRYAEQHGDGGAVSRITEPAKGRRYAQFAVTIPRKRENLMITKKAIFILLFCCLVPLVCAQNISLIKDINTIPTGSSPSRAVTMGSFAFFTADDGIHGVELWKTDGTAENTAMVKDINLGTYSSSPSNLVEMNGILYFFTSHGVAGKELWRSNGTEAGTVMVAYISSSMYSSPSELVAMNGILYFSADDGTHGPELWKSDGSDSGTQMIIDIDPRSYGTAPSYLTAVNGTLFFVASDHVAGLELWKSDGTASGTSMVKIINPSTSDYSGGPQELVNSNGVLFFTANDGTNGRELWKSDGTASGTVLVQNLDTDTTDYSGPENLVSVGNKVFLILDTTEGLWASDGTATGTVKVSSATFPRALTAMNGLLFFNANGDLWKSDGTLSGTTMVHAVAPIEMCNVSGTLFFNGYDSSSGYELWKSDGTLAGTMLVKDAFAGNSGVSPTNLSDFNGFCLFSATEASYGQEIWISNGSSAGTFNVKDINTVGTLDSELADFVGYNNNLYFYVLNGTAPGLWRSDGSGDGTYRFRQITPGSYRDEVANCSAAYGGFLFFSDGYTLYKSDGSALGTLEFYSDSGSLWGIHSLFPLRTINDSQQMLYFAVDDRLYKTAANGTPQRLKDTAFGMFKGEIRHMTSVYPDVAPQNAQLFFTCHTGGLFSDYQLFVSNGTISGTREITVDFSNDSDPQNLTNVNGVCFFT